MQKAVFPIQSHADITKAINYMHTNYTQAINEGKPFSCFTADVEIIPLVDRTEEFEAFFTAQPFFKNLTFIHGDKLFDFDKGIGYRNLTVQVGYVCFCKGDGEFVLND